MNILHSSLSDEWGTPSYLVEMAREVLGTIELDPCSTSQWNMTVKANEFSSSSLYTQWCTEPKSIFINPPGGKIGNRSLTAMFWHALCEHLRKELIEHAIWMGFSLEQLAISQSYDDFKMINYPICIPTKRIKFDYQPGISGIAPSHSNFILYIPGCINRSEKFLKVFKELGAIKD